MTQQTILFAKDFQPDGKNPSKADLYEINPEIHEHILEVNEMLQKMNEADNTKLASFLLEQTKINNEISTYCFKHFPDISVLKITNNGLGLELGIEASHKLEKKAKLKF
jgi:hypothetical protein